VPKSVPIVEPALSRLKRVQPGGRGKRHITQPLRADPPLHYETLSDPILVRRAKDGDCIALEALCSRHAQRIARLSAQVLSDPGDAEDAAQEALVKLCQRLGQFRGDSQFSTWLHRLVLNTCRDVSQRQRARRCEPLFEDARVAGDADPVREAILQELRNELGVELAGISPAQARVVVLKDAFGYSFAEIAVADGIPVGTAKCYAHRGRKSLRRRLEAVETT
jgi:RNA polymerase sigma-70 factor (ECF subfamily)